MPSGSVGMRAPTSFLKILSYAQVSKKSKIKWRLTLILRKNLWAQDSTGTQIHQTGNLSTTTQPHLTPTEQKTKILQLVFHLEPLGNWPSSVPNQESGSTSHRLTGCFFHLAATLTLIGSTQLMRYLKRSTMEKAEFRLFFGVWPPMSRKRQIVPPF